MFRVIELSRLSDKESLDAVMKPIESARCPVKFTEESVEIIVRQSGGYPYFIQFICREVYDIWVSAGPQSTSIPALEITRKLDTDFFAGRWARATDRQRELMHVIAHLANCDGEFSVQEIVENSAETREKKLTPAKRGGAKVVLWMPPIRTECSAGVIRASMTRIPSDLGKPADFVSSPALRVVAAMR